MQIAAYLSVAAASYLLGCFNGSIVVSKYILRDDVRNHGSGNAGLTNFHRTFGSGLAFAVILSDMLKGILAVLVGRWAFAPMGEVRLGMMLAALFAILGHIFPCMFAFKGGKGILTGGAIALLLDWRIAVTVWAAFALIAVLTRWVSLASVAAAVSFPVAVWFAFGGDTRCTILAVLIGGLIVWKHRGNIGRLLAGTEPKFTRHKKEGER